MQTVHPQPAAASSTLTPARIFETLLFSHLRADGLSAAISLGIFTAIADGVRTARGLATRCNASERGIRSLCNFLTVNKFLTKTGDEFGLTPEADTFLNEHSPAYVGSAAAFMNSDFCRWGSENIKEAIQSGAVRNEALENAAWCKFAEAMLPLSAPLAAMTAERLKIDDAARLDVLDLAASHGEYGIAIARRNRNARVTALDLPQVVPAAARRAAQSGVGDRFETIGGDFFITDFGGPYDVVLIPMVLHSHSAEQNARLLAKAYAALRPGGQLAVVEFVPNPDRVSPPWPAMFSLTMISHNDGDVYTYSELQSALSAAGFTSIAADPLLPSPATLLIATK